MVEKKNIINDDLYTDESGLDPPLKSVSNFGKTRASTAVHKQTKESRGKCLLLHVLPRCRCDGNNKEKQEKKKKKKKLASGPKADNNADRQ